MEAFACGLPNSVNRQGTPRRIPVLAICAILLSACQVDRLGTPRVAPSASSAAPPCETQTLDHTETDTIIGYSLAPAGGQTAALDASQGCDAAWSVHGVAGGGDPQHATITFGLLTYGPNGTEDRPAYRVEYSDGVCVPYNPPPNRSYPPGYTPPACASNTSFGVLVDANTGDLILGFRGGSLDSSSASPTPEPSASP